jgi:hypothetical protein
MPDPLENLDPARELWSLADIAKAMGCGKRTIVQLRIDGKLPPPCVQLSRKLIRWRKEVILSWLRWGTPDQVNWRALVAGAQRQPTAPGRP